MIKIFWLFPFLLHGKTPVVKWAQSASKLFLSILVPDVEKPKVTFEPDRISLSALSKGEMYDLEMKLMRNINAQTANYTATAWHIDMTIDKEVIEPCWLRLLKPKGAFSWLKKNYKDVDVHDCQHAKEIWREGYFTQKLEKQSKGSTPLKEQDKEMKEEAWQETIKSYRKKAIPQ